MNKRQYLLILVLIGLLTAVLFGACEQGEVPEVSVVIEKPEIVSIPTGWYLSEDTPYPAYANTGFWGLIEYTDEEDADFVQVFYGDVPPDLRGKERDSNALISWVIYESTAFVPSESGTMNINGRLAGYTKAYDSELDVYDMEIVFVHESTCVDIYTCFDATTRDEEEVMSIVESIYFERD